MSAEVSQPLAAPLERARRPKAPRRSAAFLLPLLSALIGLALWEAAVDLWAIPEYLLPAPSRVIVSLSQNWPMLVGELGFTALAAAAGFAIALVLGISCGAAITASRTIDRMLYPWLVISHAVPKVVVAPLFIVWIGFGLKSEILFVVVFTFFPVIVNTVTGLKSADLDLLTLARSMGASPLQILWKIRIPAALPAIFAGIKVSATLAPVGAVIGEFVASNQGLGHVLIQAVGSLETTLAFAAVIVISVFGIAIWYLAEWAERLSIPWHASQRGSAPTAG
jgi:NitT/TauT family transport system permease protein